MVARLLEAGRAERRWGVVVEEDLPARFAPGQRKTTTKAPQRALHDG
jgi:hypothetical protein